MAITNRQPPRGARLFEDIIGSPNLVVLMPMNEQSGALYDRGPNRYDAAVSGNPAYSKSIICTYGLDLDGTGDYASMGDLSGLGFERTDAFSIMAMIDPNISALGEILSKWDGSGAGWALGMNSTRTWRLRCRAPSPGTASRHAVTRVRRAISTPAPTTPRASACRARA
ncbi:MAG: hypothetical protein NTZ05_07180, partial [Chloroflexi bacterium]|nr:hypothetical protein [Chloroflexota bacterium]